MLFLICGTTTNHYSPSKPCLCPCFHWCPQCPWSHISGTRHHSIVVFGVVSEDLRCPELNYTTKRALGCPRKEITFFSKRTTSHEKPKLVLHSQDPQVYCGIGPCFGGIRHFTFPLQGQCAKAISTLRPFVLENETVFYQLVFS